MAAYYNEIDPFAAEWLRKLIAAGHIAPGEVDERSISDVAPDDLKCFTQCHFFAGIGVWSYALRKAQWADNTPVWTGSCPCQGFSSAGKRGGFSDKRHLWPAWFRLIRERKPSTVFGEQVASPDGLAWFDVVSADLEGKGYSVGAADLCAAGVGAPHIRQRLYWLADTDGSRRAQGRAREAGGGGGAAWVEPSRLCVTGGLGNSDKPGLEGRRECVSPRGSQRASEPAGFTNGFWAGAEWIHCRDKKTRPIEPGTFPLAYGAPARVGRLRGYGNALCAETARVFIASYLDLL